MNVKIQKEIEKAGNNDSEKQKKKHSYDVNQSSDESFSDDGYSNKKNKSKRRKLRVLIPILIEYI